MSFTLAASIVKPKDLVMDKLLELVGELEEARVDLEEANECGDLDERLKMALKVSELEELLFKASMIETGGL